MVMFIRIRTPFLLIFVNFLSFIRSSVVPPPSPVNLSHFLYPLVTTFTEFNAPPQPAHFLQGVLDVIATKEKWVMEDIRVSEVDLKKVKYRPVQSYEFLVRLGKTKIVFKMHEEMSEWNKLESVLENKSSKLEGMAKEINSKAVIDSFKVEGPFELLAARDDDLLSLMLPLNKSYSSFRRMSVGEGITVEVKDAQEISIFHQSDHHNTVNGFLHYLKQDLSVPYGLCPAVLPIHILGSASVVAYRTARPAAIIQTVFSSRDAIRLLPEKCYLQPNYSKPGHHLLGRISLVKRVLKSFVNERSNNTTTASMRSVKTKIRASAVFRFQLELERDIRSDEISWSSTLAEWRTKPAMERAWLEVAARMEDGILKPVSVRKVKPIMDTDDSYSLSSLLPNVSFTKFPSALVAPQALTLDVRW